MKKDKKILASSGEVPALASELTLRLQIETPPPKKNRRRRKIQGKKTGALALGIAVVLLIWGASRWAGAEEAGKTLVPKIPQQINFQSVLTDPGGTPLSDGLHPVTFRILNARGDSFYEETQTLESQKGVVSAMVGARGGLPEESLSPDQPKFLGVRVEANGPENILEISSVPYAFYAKEALSAAPLSIETGDIRLKAITADLLADDVLVQLLAGLTPDRVPASLVSQNQFNSSIQAMAIDVQTQSGRIDLEAAQRRGDVVTLQQLITQISATLQTISPAPNVAPKPPQLVAAGSVVFVDERNANLDWGYNITALQSRLESEVDNRFPCNQCAAIFFQAPIEQPYLVQLTPMAPVNIRNALPADGAPLYVREMTGSRLIVESSATPFHFVVYK